jgi:protein-tyrosine phosphatase
MAEFIMKDLIAKNGLQNDFQIASAATSNEEIGNPVYPPVKRLLNKRGISCDGKRAIRVTKGDYDYYDYLICMDSNNIRNLYRVVGLDEKQKVSKLLDYTDSPHDVADPWYTDDFETTEQDIQTGCEKLLEFILNK